MEAVHLELEPALTWNAGIAVSRLSYWRHWHQLPAFKDDEISQEIHISTCSWKKKKSQDLSFQAHISATIFKTFFFKNFTWDTENERPESHCLLGNKDTSFLKKLFIYLNRKITEGNKEIFHLLGHSSHRRNGCSSARFSGCQNLSKGVILPYLPGLTHFLYLLLGPYRYAHVPPLVFSWMVPKALVWPLVLRCELSFL